MMGRPSDVRIWYPLADFCPRSHLITILNPLRLLTALCGIALICSAGAVSAATHARVPTFPNVRVSKDQYLAHSEPALAQNPRNHKDLIAGSKMFTDPDRYAFKVGTYYSKDGGKTWHDSGFLPGFDSFSLVTDVSIAFAADGTAYACVMAWDGGNVSGVYVLSSTDGGKTFSAPVPVFVDSTGAYLNDKPWVAVDNTNGPNRGTVYVAWNLDSWRAAKQDPDSAGNGFFRPRAATEFGNGGIAVSHSTDGGKTYSDPAIVAPFDQQHFYIGAIPAVAPDGQVYIPFLSYDGSDEVDGMAMVSSSDGGQTYSDVRIVQDDVIGLPNHLPKSNFRNTSMPSFAISPKDGAMVIVWGDYRYKDADVMATTSRDHGRTWSAPIRVNHDKLRNGKDQFEPAIAASPNGIFTCAWFDRRYDPHNKRIDEVVAQSSSDGRAFGPALRVTEDSWDPAIDAPRPEGKATNTFIGDYQALAVDDHTIHPLWNDTQNGKSQEIRSATMSIQFFKRR